MKHKLSKVDRLEITKEALRHTELYLTGLEAYASNADKRAATFFAGGIALASFFLTISEFLPFMFLNLVAALIAIVAAIFALYEMLPKPYFTLGHRWSQWSGHLKDDDSLEDVLASQATENDIRIESNIVWLKGRQERLRKAGFLLILSVVVAIVTQLVGYLCEAGEFLWYSDRVGR